MTVTIRLPQPLRVYADSAAAVEVDGATVGEALGALDKQLPAVGRRILDEQGCIRRHLMVFVGDERTHSLDTALADGAELSIIPAVSGGSC